MTMTERPEELPDDWPNCSCGKRKAALYRLGYFCKNCSGWIGR